MGHDRLSRSEITNERHHFPLFSPPLRSQREALVPAGGGADTEPRCLGVMVADRQMESGDEASGRLLAPQTDKESEFML